MKNSTEKKEEYLEDARGEGKKSCGAASAYKHYMTRHHAYGPYTSKNNIFMLLLM